MTLTLEREPSVEEVKNEFSKFDMNKYKEVVFCGFGEPTERLDDVLEVCRFIKDKYNKTIRIESFDAMIKFAENVKHYVKEVVLSTVSTTLTEEEEKECADICKKIGVTYRIRPFED